MEQNLKQRLVGALVLISLAVIFLPLVFDRQQNPIDTSAYRIPEKPAITLTAPDLEPLVQAAQSQVAEVNQVVAARKAQDEASADPAQVEQPAVKQAPVQPVTPDPVAQTREYLVREKAVDAGLQKQPVTTPVPLAEAWMIQVGAFSSEPNARSLRDKLKAAGHPAFLKSTPTASGRLYKVYVGPEIRRATAEQQKSALERQYNLKALILKYIP